MTKQIPLTKGAIALIDDEDFDRIAPLKWCCCNGYAGKQINKKFVYMHRFIMNAPPDMFVDHINGNTLDNRKSNLRLSSEMQNARNQSVKRIAKTSNYKGVSLSKNGRKWCAFIKIGYRSKYIGVFNSELEAARAYDEAAIEAFGEFAKTNFEVGNADAL